MQNMEILSKTFHSVSQRLCYLNANFPNHLSSHVHRKIHGNCMPCMETIVLKNIALNVDDGDDDYEDNNKMMVKAVWLNAKVLFCVKSSGNLCTTEEKTTKQERAQTNRMNKSSEKKKYTGRKHTLLQLSKCHLTSSNFKNGSPPTVDENTNELQNNKNTQNAYAIEFAFSFALTHTLMKSVYSVQCIPTYK